MKLLTCCTVAAALASGSAAAMLPIPLYDFSVWAATVLKKHGIEDATVVEAAFPISFSYCPKGSTALWRYQAISPEQLESLNRGEGVPTSDSNFEMIEPASAVCTAVKT
ncbi:hypothetical protein [Pseudomonas corrugata]|uniref:hypothetical protein n=1 Tax=Pseudomonas corrugata TaxID=47879 RepID=UPI0006D893C7|nr:hypothetical protein [Pseudomonas corrugata]